MLGFMPPVDTAPEAPVDIVADTPDTGLTPDLPEIGLLECGVGGTPRPVTDSLE